MCRGKKTSVTVNSQTRRKNRCVTGDNHDAAAATDDDDDDDIPFTELAFDNFTSACYFAFHLRTLMIFSEFLKFSTCDVHDRDPEVWDRGVYTEISRDRDYVAGAVEPSQYYIVDSQ